MLNPNQQDAVDETGNALVIAGPGSGKTRVIIAKILKIQQDSASNRVTAVTFTRDAADELTHRVSKELERVHGADIGKRYLQQCRIGTFHSLAIQQLRDAGQLGKLATPREQAAFITQAAKACSTEDDRIPYETAVEAVEKAKCAIDRTGEAMEHPVVRTYQSILERNRMSDLYDVIRDAVVGMREGTVAPMRSGTIPCTHLLVDEFQDSDEVQYAWIMEHVRRNVVTMVVGDDDQTIYEWRRALGYRGMTNFQEDAGAREIVLGDNYRCREEILSYADNLIRHNRGNRIEKNLVAAKGPGGTVEVICGADLGLQAAAMVEQIEPYLQPNNEPNSVYQFTLPEGEWAIIARNHAALHAVEAVLSGRHIKYQRAGGGFWGLPYMAVFLALLKSIQQGTPAGIDIALSFLGMTHETMQIVHAAADTRFSRFLDGQITEFPGMDKSQEHFIQTFTARTAGWRDSLKTGAYRHVITGVASMLIDEALHKKADEPKANLLRIGADIVDEMGNRPIKTPKGTRAPSLAERVDFLERPKQKTSDGVALHTMHSCKGLEFNQVGVFHISSGVLPNPERLDDINDRRLIYVAMTRAKERLWLSYIAAERSYFFDEIGFSKDAVAA